MQIRGKKRGDLLLIGFAAKWAQGTGDELIDWRPEMCYPILYRCARRCRRLRRRARARRISCRQMGKSGRAGEIAQAPHNLWRRAWRGSSHRGACIETRNRRWLSVMWMLEPLRRSAALSVSQSCLPDAASRQTRWPEDL